MPDTIILASAQNWSGALRRKLTGEPQFASWLAQAATSPVTRQTIYQWHDDICHEHPEQNANAVQTGLLPGTVFPVVMLRQTLRRLRERVFFTLMVRDINGEASLLEVVTATTTLADFAIAHAYRSVMAELTITHGIPRHPHTGLPQEMLVVGMGKLGGRELNVSSDIDLIMLYAAEGTTAGPRKISHHEFYGRVARHMLPILSEHDAQGYVFRSDMRLRPDGNSGPLAWSLPALEKYFLNQGREWERYAWTKARIINCKAFPDSRPAYDAQRLESLRIPFVYRKYLDFDALAALRDLRNRIRLDWEQRARKRSGIDKTHNIKLGDGGIREIEFVIQMNQLVRGGRLPSLQQRGLHPALYKQRKAGVLAETVAQRLEQAYFFLRRTEHMLQYREDEQTHLLPRDPEQRTGLAQALGMSPSEFETTLTEHRQVVADTFRDAFRIAGVEHGHNQEANKPVSMNASLSDSTQKRPEQQNEFIPDIQKKIDALLQSRRINALPKTSRARLKRLLPTILQISIQFPDPVSTATRLLNLIEHIASRSAYIALLAEYPDTLKRVARIVSASPWAAQYLRQYPVLLDSLIEWNTLMKAPDFHELASQLRAELDACLLPDGSPDIEQQMNLMRDVQHQVTFQLLAQDLAHVLTVEELADHLSALADMLLQETINRVWPLVQKHKPSQTHNAAHSQLPEDSVPDNTASPDIAAPRFAVIAYGKLGGKELGYASDLDLVFLYDDPEHDASERYTRLGRRMSSWLSTLTSSGRLYDVDLRLRPDGDAGLLAVTIDAFENYQSHHAWPWEHQAITRARFAAGDPDIGARFETLRKNILLMPRDRTALKAQVKEMRAKISTGHPNRSPDFDIKHDRGGMVDVEFVIQYLVLGYAQTFPVLLKNLGNINLLRLSGDAGLIPSPLASNAADAYRTYRRRQHALRLQGAERARIPIEELAEERATVLELWNIVLGD